MQKVDDSPRSSEICRKAAHSVSRIAPFSDHLENLAQRFSGIPLFDGDSFAAAEDIQFLRMAELVGEGQAGVTVLMSDGRCEQEEWVDHVIRLLNKILFWKR